MQDAILVHLEKHHIFPVKDECKKQIGHNGKKQKDAPENQHHLAREQKGFNEIASVEKTQDQYEQPHSQDEVGEDLEHHEEDTGVTQHIVLVCPTVFTVGTEFNLLQFCRFGLEG